MHIDLKREIKGSGLGKAGFIILLLVMTVALAAPFIAPYDPYAPSTSALEPPSGQHWLGTNHIGQDILSQLIYAARTSLVVGLRVGILSTLFGATAGVSAALVGGIYERVIMKIVDVLMVIPAVIVVVLISAYIRPDIITLILTLSLLSWQGGARVTRSQALWLKERGHIGAARSFGASRFYLARRHILPDQGLILMVHFIYGVRRAIFMEAGLAFLGVSDATTLSWGMMMRDALSFSYLNNWQWWLMPTGIALSLTIIGLTFVGHAIEPVIEPRLRVVEVA